MAALAAEVMITRQPMVFVLDNYDSFTYNLVQYLGELGAEVEVRRNDRITPAEVEAMHPNESYFPRDRVRRSRQESQSR